MSRPELPSALASQVAELLGSGDAFAIDLNRAHALAEFRKAWALLPDPKTDWPMSARILSSIGDMQFYWGVLDEARAALESALTCPDGDQPFTRLRLGQVLMKQGDLDAAADQLELALRRANGEWIFAQEDPAVLAFLRQRKGLH